MTVFVDSRFIERTFADLLDECQDLALRNAKTQFLVNVLSSGKMVLVDKTFKKRLLSAKDDKNGGVSIYKILMKKFGESGIDIQVGKEGLDLKSSTLDSVVAPVALVGKETGKYDLQYAEEQKAIWCLTESNFAKKQRYSSTDIGRRFGRDEVVTDAKELLMLKSKSRFCLIVDPYFLNAPLNDASRVTRDIMKAVYPEHSTIDLELLICFNARMYNGHDWKKYVSGLRNKLLLVEGLGNIKIGFLDVKEEYHERFIATASELIINDYGWSQLKLKKLKKSVNLSSWRIGSKEFKNIYRIAIRKYIEQYSDAQRMDKDYVEGDFCEGIMNIY